MTRSGLRARTRLAGAAALALALAAPALLTPPAALASTSPSTSTSARPPAATSSASSPLLATAGSAALPRHCFAEYTVTGRGGVVTSLTHADREFAAYAYDGWKISPAPRFVEPVGYDVGRRSVTLTSLVARPDGILESVRVHAASTGGATASPGLSWGLANAPAAAWKVDPPVRVGRGWHQVRDVAVPGEERAPYLFALLGDRLNRYTVRPDAKGNAIVRTGPHAATAGFAGVRSITWTRQTTVRGVPADVLVGLDGARLVEYTVPRTERPRVITRELVGRGWGAITRVDAGACFTSSSPSARVTRSVPVLGTMGRSVRLYVDRDATDGSGRDIANHGQVGLRP